MASIETLRKFIDLINKLEELINNDAHVISMEEITGLGNDDLAIYRKRAMRELRILEKVKYDQWSGRK